jgi:hypothetical protein
LNFKAKKIRFIETEFFMKGKIENSGGKKKRGGPEEKRSESHSTAHCLFSISENATFNGA